jgi:lysophospholipase L1-like esterase
MQNILIYGDSLTSGIIPLTRKRFAFHERWPGVLENELNAAGRGVRVIEDCLNGRRTVLDDPFKPGRNGIVGLGQRIEIHSPLALVILMLGTNDFQSVHLHNASHAAQGIAALVGAIQRAPIEPGMPVPTVLVVAPPPLENPLGCPFFDAASVTSSSRLDGVHLDLDQHLVLGKAMSSVVRSLLISS